MLKTFSCLTLSIFCHCNCLLMHSRWRQKCQLNHSIDSFSEWTKKKPFCLFCLLTYGVSWTTKRDKREPSWYRIPNSKFLDFVCGFLFSISLRGRTTNKLIESEIEKTGGGGKTYPLKVDIVVFRSFVRSFVSFLLSFFPSLLLSFFVFFLPSFLSVWFFLLLFFVFRTSFGDK